MKIRNGFVSNSSSSSFLLVFDKKPESKEELAHAMFGKEFDPAMYEFIVDKLYSQYIENATNTATNDEIIEKFTRSSDYVYSKNYDVICEQIRKISGADYQLEYDLMDKFIYTPAACNSEKLALEFIKENAGKFVAVVEIGDSGGFGITNWEVENNPECYFKNITFKKFSNH